MPAYTIFPINFSSIPTMTVQILDDSKPGGITEEAIFHLIRDVNFQKTAEISVNSTVARKPVTQLVSRKPTVARFTVVTASHILVAAALPNKNVSVDSGHAFVGETNLIQMKTDYRAQLSFMDRMYGRLVRVTHRAGVVEGICSNLDISDKGDVVGKTEAGSDDARISVGVEITQVRRQTDGSGIKLGKIRYPVSAPAVESITAKRQHDIDNALPGAGESSCVRKGNTLVVGVRDAYNGSQFSRDASSYFGEVGHSYQLMGARIKFGTKALVRDSKAGNRAVKDAYFGKCI